MTKTTTTFRGSILSACADGLVGPHGLTDAGRSTVERLADYHSEDRDAAIADVEAYLTTRRERIESAKPAE